MKLILAIVLGSIKPLSWKNIFSCLHGNFNDKENILTLELIKHILKYYPNEEEVCLYIHLCSIQHVC